MGKRGFIRFEKEEHNDFNMGKDTYQHFPCHSSARGRALEIIDAGGGCHPVHITRKRHAPLCYDPTLVYLALAGTTIMALESRLNDGSTVPR